MESDALWRRTEGGQVQMPLGKTFWSPRFGMVTDQFGRAGWLGSPSTVRRRQRTL